MKQNRAVFGLLALSLFARLGAAQPLDVPRAKPRAPSAPKLTPAAIDQMIRAAWQQRKIVPAPPVDDARFLRRIYLDITGTIPPPEAVTAFLADRSPDKRAKAVDALLNSPRYALHWTNYWDGVLMGRQFRAGVVDRVAFKQWLHAQFAKNAPWNRFVFDLLTATGVNSRGGSYARALGAMMPADAAMEATLPSTGETEQDRPADRLNGAVNWLLKHAQNPADLAGNASRLFLGVQIQCAQCHDHKTEKWTQEDFRRFTACFAQTRPFPVEMGRPQGIRRLEVRDITLPRLRGRRAAGRNEYANATPAALDGTDFSDSPNRRQALAAWITAPENPWFAQAIVNRMWARFLGRGFVEPVDDFRPSNPPVLPGLLKRLADDFTAHHYDLKHLIRTICATEVYQRSSTAARNATDPDNTLWARYRLKPLGPEELVDSVVAATNLGPVLEKIGGHRVEQIKFLIQRQFTFLFDVDEEMEQKEFEGTIPQALLLLNGHLIHSGASAIPGTALGDILAMPGGDEKKIEALYLRTVSRKPTPAEQKRWTAFVNAPRDVILDTGGSPTLQERGQIGRSVRRIGGRDPFARIGNRLSLNAARATPKQQAYEDLFWALLNSSEFMFNH